ncbi:MAG TPA: hypothetical protein VHU22_14400 [Xanthobacteraceae bacterium]|jgi:hypothetical protein|nr:hypothetical protein [Xanthobacteraceae bacterium]
MVFATPALPVSATAVRTAIPAFIMGNRRGSHKSGKALPQPLPIIAPGDGRAATWARTTWLNRYKAYRLCSQITTPD